VGIVLFEEKNLVEHPKLSKPWRSYSPDPAAWLLQMSQYPHGTIFMMSWPTMLWKVFG
jgi:hypothetical protein